MKEYSMLICSFPPFTPPPGYQNCILYVLWKCRGIRYPIPRSSVQFYTHLTRSILFQKCQLKMRMGRTGLGLVFTASPAAMASTAQSRSART